jgi:hypothetical protein
VIRLVSWRVIKWGLSITKLVVRSAPICIVDIQYLRQALDVDLHLAKLSEGGPSEDAEALLQYFVHFVIFNLRIVYIGQNDWNLV